MRCCSNHYRNRLRTQARQVDETAIRSVQLLSVRCCSNQYRNRLHTTWLLQIACAAAWRTLVATALAITRQSTPVAHRPCSKWYIAVIAAMKTSDVRPNTTNEYSKLRNVLDMRAPESYHSEKNFDDDGVFTGTELALWTTSGHPRVSKSERRLRIVPCHETHQCDESQYVQP